MDWLTDELNTDWLTDWSTYWLTDKNKTAFVLIIQYNVGEVLSKGSVSS